ncbi:DNA ligase D [Pseudoxanthomonas suwonensis]|uniref:DNA ligase (ATP) n=1 Tax=Pseudoxanthomonas suwonensis TaxID=314722 RepID=A0A0E3Z1B7_9GAMM|nr:DNA ligase D [Pseudoxanthomonas suwonensis]AKC86678.1 DNA ligase [Pseudoxanthomonas suwonensis]
MSLRDYARKRDFGATPEPQGAARRRSADRRPVFVVQLHHASHRHYDFRLEADGVLKSWAVPKGPSLRPGEKRLAVQVEDHPLDYADFEGDIPAGHYGAGHVDLFDRGTWAIDGDPLAAIAKGKLDFELHGDKLNGAWKLVRTGLQGRQPQWLLIKRSDAHAADVEADDLVDGAAPKRPRATRTATTAPPVGARLAGDPTPPAKATLNATSPKRRTSTTTRPSPRKQDATWRKRALALPGARARLHPPGFAPELCTLRAAPPAGDGWLHEIKWDGYRLLADLVEGEVRLRSRNDLDWTARVPEVTRAVEALPVSDARLDGELVVLDAQGHSDFSALQRVLEGSSRQPLRYLLFDLPGLAGVDLARAPLAGRKALLQRLLGKRAGVLAYSDHVVGHGAEVLAASGRAGFEGIVSKRVDAPYAGGRGQDWIKTKHEQGDEFVVVGYTAPKGARGHFGSLLLGRPEAGGLRYVGRVGSGFGDEALRELYRRMRPLAQGQASVALPAHVPFSARSVHWIKPELVVEVAFRGWAKEGLLRQASYRRLREDKAMAELTASSDRDARTGVAASKRRTRSAASDDGKRGEAPPQGAEVAISHPERVVYAGDGITKGHVAAYYRAVARWILPELARRPLSLLRCPDGTGGECFFQKHLGRGFGPQVHALPLRQKSGVEDYLYLDDEAGLLQLVQMNAIEFHPWGATVDDPERADRLVFDLDPGEGVSWKQVRDAAREVRARLREAGLDSFLRMSGGKGLHVVVPLAPAVPWEQARDFCEAFARAMAAHAPERYVASMRKDLRGGRIFLDWLRNTRGATSVCGWSLRAREHATVAMPLRWEELAKIASPGAFTLDKALQRAARLRKDPWDGIGAIRQALPTA